MSIQSLCIHKVDIEQETTSRGASGGTIRGWESVATGFPCRCRPLDAKEVTELAKAGIVANWRVAFYKDPSVDERCRLLFTDAAGVVHTLYVKGVKNSHALNRLWLAEAFEEGDVENV